MYLLDFEELGRWCRRGCERTSTRCGPCSSCVTAWRAASSSDTLTGERARELHTEWGEILEMLVLRGRGRSSRRRAADRRARRSSGSGGCIAGWSGWGARSTPTRPREYHELRKKGKELRYLLELFAEPLYDASVVKPLVKALKGLQDVLGRHQDREVQIEMLKEIGARARRPSPAAPTR